MLDKEARWERNTDIIVVGFGGAGAVAAMVAHDLGAKVLVVEKQPENAHYTNTRMSGGLFICPNDVEKAIVAMNALYQVNDELWWTDPQILQTWAQRTAENKEWLEKLGAKLMHAHTGIRSGEHEVPGFECMEGWRFRGRGWGMHNFLLDQVKRRGIPVLYNTPARKLITNLDGAVVGVRVEREEGGQKRTMDIQARQAVIMTLGGFEFNEELKLNYLRVYPSYFYGTPANTGDGIGMVQEVGASLWHMNCVSARVVAKFPDFPVAFTMTFGAQTGLGRTLGGEHRRETCGYILVDRDGKRFTNERYKGHTFYYELTLYDSHRYIYPRVPCSWLFDRKRIEAGPLPMTRGGPSGPVRLYSWSKDNSKEIEKGWIIQGNSIPELAQRLELSPVTLEETIRRYNNLCAQGKDADFHRPLNTLAPLNTPPFYAVRMYPGGPNTQGGPRHNHKSQVLKANGETLPHLYAVGEFGSLYGMLYPGGGNLAECIAFGRIAAENACQEEPLP